MEAVGAVFGIADVALRASSKLWKLSGTWRDAPADIHRLRDDLVRTERFFGETQQGIETLYTMSGDIHSESHSLWSELERLLDTGSTVIRQIDEFIDNVCQGSGIFGTSQPLSKRRRIVWMTSSKKVRALREELRGIISGICRLLIAHNVSISAETYMSVRESQNAMVVDVKRRIDETHNMTVSRLTEALEMSQDKILAQMDRRLRIMEGVLADREASAQTSRLPSVDKAPEGVIHCRCRCHIPGKTSWRITSFRSLVGSVVVTYRGAYGRVCNRSSCHGHPTGIHSTEVHVVYHLPAWLARASLATSLSAGAVLGGPQVMFGLRIYNRVPVGGYDRGLMAAVGRSDTNGVRKMLEARTPSFYDLAGEYGQSPLSLAVCRRVPEITKLLLQAGADQWLETANGGGLSTSPIGVAFRYTLTGYPHDAEIAQLFSFDEFIQEADFRPLHLAIMGNLHIDLSKALQQPGYRVDIERRARNGLNALDLAVIKGDVKAVQLLIAAGADVNARDEDTTKCPPLERACIHGRYEIAEILLEAGASVTAQDYQGWTALDATCSAIYSMPEAPEIISRLIVLLLRYGANPHTREYNTGATLFLRAIEDWVLGAAETLLTHGLDVNDAYYNGHRGLSIAIKGNFVPGIEFLLDHGCDIHFADNGGDRLIHWLARYGDVATMQFFTRTKAKYRLREGFSTSEKNAERMTPLDAFTQRKHAGGVSKETEEAFDELLETVEEMQHWRGDADWPENVSDDEFVDALELPDVSSPTDDGLEEGRHTKLGEDAGGPGNN